MDEKFTSGTLSHCVCACTCSLHKTKTLKSLFVCLSNFIVIVIFFFFYVTSPSGSDSGSSSGGESDTAKPLIPASATKVYFLW